MNAGMCVEAFTLSVWREDWLDVNFLVLVVLLFSSFSFSCLSFLPPSHCILK